MSERNYYVICEDKCLFPSMTREQILAAIAEATGHTSIDIDDAFITKIREMNASKNLRFWTGTTAEFNALETKAEDTLYILTDDDSMDGFEEMAETLEKILSGEVTVGSAASAVATDFTNAQWANLTANTVFEVGSTYEVKMFLTHFSALGSERGVFNFYNTIFTVASNGNFSQNIATTKFYYNSFDEQFTSGETEARFYISGDKKFRADLYALSVDGRGLLRTLWESGAVSDAFYRKIR